MRPTVRRRSCGSHTSAATPKIGLLRNFHGANRVVRAIHSAGHRTASNSRHGDGTMAAMNRLRRKRPAARVSAAIGGLLAIACVAPLTAGAVLPQPPPPKPLPNPAFVTDGTVNALTR